MTIPDPKKTRDPNTIKVGASTVEESHQIPDKWLQIIKLEIIKYPSRSAAILAGILLVAVLWGKFGFSAGVGTMAILLLVVSRPHRELLVATALLGVTFWGFSGILRHVLEPGSITPSKTAIIITVILAWTILAALCLGRLHGGRDDD